MGGEASKGNQYLEAFLKVYFGLPLEERKLPVAVIDGNPISWNMTYRELSENTGLGRRIGAKLVKLKII
ncbi:hypothetical protein COX85_03290 [Candidatus Micrarchaeota archaeon CG_4_10_14_0_2_um_filter_55_9]|nr:MAG: hypothetical protein AUJ15_03515 [Candidatus Micrarchaeota archaeon CG1_02_55_41]PIO03675.1 MAG: hypothetical protein COT57_00420 [Candidatus Micrarchaeota archaeon CG09_land_8_20_14_0_10_55_25]PIZ91550.1 MAG: hypothetical protein COX85_03290 [Candidatus Micrarchaeota archaeon CG_4_10_14_0_2_um_filter_55_9]PJD01405.1 MAG: hypothetical protein COU38_01165 [Candidatus Micrarchaeota archaeon CG10_big_fil_rev_8_21_14_0_10_54_18]